MGPHTHFAFRLDPHARFVECRPPLLEDRIAFIEALFDFADRRQVLFHPLPIGVAEPTFQIVHVADRRIEHTAIQGDAGSSAPWHRMQYLANSG